MPCLISLCQGPSFWKVLCTLKGLTWEYKKPCRCRTTSPKLQPNQQQRAFRDRLGLYLRCCLCPVWVWSAL